MNHEAINFLNLFLTLILFEVKSSAFSTKLKKKKKLSIKMAGNLSNVFLRLLLVRQLCKRA